MRGGSCLGLSKDKKVIVYGKADGEISCTLLYEVHVSPCPLQRNPVTGNVYWKYGGAQKGW